MPKDATEIQEDYSVPSQGVRQDQPQSTPPEVGAAALNNMRCETPTGANDDRKHHDRGEHDSVLRYAN